MLTRAMMAAIRFYRAGISPLRPPACRFQPTCSAYGLEAIQRHGGGRGSWLLVKRLLRCHPFCRGGWDPVP
ncbi:membrane protein insertion efficiency factor YidD [soil metagenome]